MQREDNLQFSYKYPFSDEAKAAVHSGGSDTRRLSERHLEMAKARLEEALSKGRLEYRNIAYGKLDYIISYVYARMLVSSMGSRAAIVKFAAAEAERARAALESDDDNDVLRLAGELGLPISMDAGGNYKIQFQLLLHHMAGVPGFSLSNFKLHGGEILLDRHEAARLLENAIFIRILNGLPIKHSELPQKVIAAAKTIVQPAVTIRPGVVGSRAWIDKLLETPIPDMRHRVVNLVLAPYLVNIKGLSVEDAAKTIAVYVERCKGLDPNTKINDSYIRYQCTYAKKRGLKPLSLARAKELFGSVVDFDQHVEKEVAR